MMFFKKISHVFLTALSFTAVAVNAFAATDYSVLAYHSVIDESAPAKEQFYVPQTIPASTLINQFNWLKENGYHVISWQQVIDAEQGKGELPEKAVLLTFDDGYETMYSTIFPLLKAYHYPAVFAPVTSWISTPAGSKVDYGTKQKLDRSAFTTWNKIREMHESGLVEIASHTHDSHHGVLANPAGSQLPAMIAPIYQNGKYETREQYHNRIQKDLQTSVDLIAQYTGQKPRVMVWPYGQFTDATVNAAMQTGMTHHFSLDAEKINQVGDKHIGRLLLDAETDLNTIANYLNGRRDNQKVQRVIHVDLDYVYDPNPVQQKKNFDALIERVHRYGVTTVYLQAYADEDGNGVADKLYFPNRYLPVKADLFSQVAWQLMIRTHVNVYAWLPTFAFDLRNSDQQVDYIVDNRTGKPAPNHYLRLSPYSKKNLQIIRDIYNDLSFYAK
ncbi:poly-beta-1,6-N-acetyl-D-glucosamine N-deacetylase PgaB, partial [Avibacterium endocarditidis]